MMRPVCRVESFIEHQDTCNASRPRGETSSSPVRGGGGVGMAAASTSQQQLHAASLSRTASSASPSSDLVVSPVTWPGPAMASPTANIAAFHGRFDPALSPPTPPDRRGAQNLELQLMPPRGSCCAGGAAPAAAVGYCASQHSAAVPQLGAEAMRLQLSIGFSGARADDSSEATSAAATRLKEDAREQLRLAVAEKAAADEARAQAKRQAELAEQELAAARRMRQQAQVELSRAHSLRDHAVRQIDATLLQITCYRCRHKFQGRAAALSSEVASYVSSVVTEGGDPEVDNDDHHQLNADDHLPRSHHARMDIN